MPLSGWKKIVASTAASPAVWIVAAKKIQETRRRRQDRWLLFSGQERLALRAGRVYGENNHRAENRGMRQERGPLRAPRARGLLPLKQMNRRAVRGKRKQRTAKKKLAQVFSNAEKPGIA